MARTCPSRGFSLVEMLVTISIIGILTGIAFTAMSGIRGTDVNLRSRNNLRQIHTWMTNYSGNHQDRVVPSQFDYYDENGGEVGGIASRTGYSSSGTELDWIPSNNLLAGGGDPREGFVSRGSWADILWVENNLLKDAGTADFSLVAPGGAGIVPGADGTTISYQYRAPDRHLYDYEPGYLRNPLRSVGVNSFHFPRRLASGGQVVLDPSLVGSSSSGGLPIGLPKPFGAGAWEKGYPGYFAANNFFDARSERDQSVDFETGSKIDRFLTYGQIRDPARSMYLVDSFAGVTIGGNQQNESATVDAFHVQDVDSVGTLDGTLTTLSSSLDSTQEVDLRYAGGSACLMLFLDGHVEQVGRFGGLGELQGQGGGTSGRGIRVTDLDRRRSEVDIGPGGP